jgi:hypothetical protein
MIPDQTFKSRWMRTAGFRKWIAALIGLLTILTAFTVFVLFPLTHQLREEIAFQSEFLRLGSNTEGDTWRQNKLQNLREQRSQLDQVSHRLNQLEAAHASLTQARWIQEIEAQLRTAGLFKVGTEIPEVQSSGSKYSLWTMRLRLRGSWPQAMRLLESLAHKPYKVQVTFLGLQQSKSGPLDIELELQTRGLAQGNP